MTTFQAILYAAVHGFTEFLPISPEAHRALIPYFLNGWPEATGATLGALSLGSFLALFVYFRHDWASIVSSFLSVILFRRRPMTLDERLPFFMFVGAIPMAAGWYYLREQLGPIAADPLWIAGGLAGFGIVLVFTDSMSRKNKGVFDYNWLDSLITGIGGLAMLLPGGGRVTGMFGSGLMKNYGREAAAKLAFYFAAPVVSAGAVRHLWDLDFGGPAPSADLSWLSFVIAVLVAFATGLLAIGGFMKNVTRKGPGGYAVYRTLLAVAVAVVYWVRTRG